MRSGKQYPDVERSLQRTWAKGAGLIDEEFERPTIAVVNTYQEFSPKNVHFRQVGEAVTSGIRMAGGTPCQFNTFHVTDSETFASVGRRYVLPSRDLAADIIEPMAKGHRFDAMVLVGSGPGSPEMSLEATGRERANDDASHEHGVGFKVTARR